MSPHHPSFDVLTQAQRDLYDLIETADGRPYQAKTQVEKDAEAKLVQMGAVDADGQFIRPSPHAGFDEVFDLFL